MVRQNLSSLPGKAGQHHNDIYRASSNLCDTVARKLGAMMRTLNILSGLAVLLATLAFGHLIYHFSTHRHPGEVHEPAFWAGIAFAIIVGIFSFIGGCLLIRRGR